MYPASIRWVAQCYPSVHWVNQRHSNHIPVYTAPASVHWFRVRVRTKFMNNIACLYSVKKAVWQRVSQNVLPFFGWDIYDGYLFVTQYRLQIYRTFPKILPVGHFNNRFSIAIRIWLKFHFALTSIRRRHRFKFRIWDNNCSFDTTNSLKHLHRYDGQELNYTKRIFQRIRMTSTKKLVKWVPARDI